MEMLEYSVLMSVYHKEKPEYLIEAIESMLNQTVPPEQFVLVEDGPLTDELYKVIDKYKKENDKLFTIVKLQENCGLGVALDRGIKVCRNDLVARMDSDDISLLDRCERQLRIYEENPQLSIISGNVIEFVDNTDKIVAIRNVPENQDDIKKQMRIRSAFNHPAVMYRKSKVLQCGGYGELKRKQDHDLFSRMMNNECLAYNIQEPILFFRADLDNLKRRKSWINCKSYIIAQWCVLKRGHCSIFDFIYVLVAQIFFIIAPYSIIKFVTYRFLRK